MPTFSYREKNVTISVRCGARCRAYHASSMGEGKGPPHNCAPARFLFFGFFNSMESAFPYEESFSVRPNPVRRRLLASGDPDGLSSGPTWCLTARKALCLRPEAPRLSSGPSLRRPGRGASLPAKPYAFVRKHHVYRPGRASGDPDVVLHSPQSLMPSSGSTTPVGSALRRLSWRRPSRKTLTLRRATPTWPGRASGDPDVVLHSPQSLIPPSGGTTSSGFPFPIRRECDEHI